MSEEMNETQAQDQQQAQQASSEATAAVPEIQSEVPEAVAPIETASEPEPEPATVVAPSIIELATEARAEYDALPEAARGMLHGAINDIETRFDVKLPSLHTLFGVR